MRVCLQSSTGVCKKNWCQTVSCNTSNCERTYYICIYLVDLFLHPHCVFCCFCALYLTSIIILSLLHWLPTPQASLVTWTPPTPRTSSYYPCVKQFGRKTKWGTIPMVVAGSVSGAYFTRSLLITQRLFIAWPISSLLESRFTWL